MKQAFEASSFATTGIKGVRVNGIVVMPRLVGDEALSNHGLHARHAATH